jgi:hypothetical protein
MPEVSNEPREQGRVLWQGLRRRGGASSDRQEPTAGRGSFSRPLVICAIGFVASFWAEYTFGLWHWPVPLEFAREAAIAFLIAAILYAALEYNAERVAHEETIRFRDLVSKDVFQALMGRIVPGPVFHEINDILHSDVVRSDCEYVISFLKPYPEMPPGYFVIRRDVMYVVANLLSRITTFWVRSYHSNDLKLDATAWQERNFHLKLSVNGEEVPLQVGVNLFIEADAATFEYPIRLGPRESARVSFRGEEPALVSAGRNTYLQATPGIGLKVEVRNEYAEVIGPWEVQMNHPGRDEVERDDFGRYVMKRAILPGQGFQVLWKSGKEMP